MLSLLLWSHQRCIFNDCEKMISVKQAKYQVLFFGLKKRCPKCGLGRIFQGYLSIRSECPLCYEPLKALRADDGPAWLTIMVTGHIVLPLAGYLEVNQVMDFWTEMTLLLFMTLGMCIILLPPFKGLFISILWMKNQSEKQKRKKS